MVNKKQLENFLIKTFNGDGSLIKVGKYWNVKRSKYQNIIYNKKVSPPYRDIVKGLNEESNSDLKDEYPTRFGSATTMYVISADDEDDRRRDIQHSDEGNIKSKRVDVEVQTNGNQKLRGAGTAQAEAETAQAENDGNMSETTEIDDIPTETVGNLDESGGLVDTKAEFASGNRKQFLKDERKKERRAETRAKREEKAKQNLRQDHTTETTRVIENQDGDTAVKSIQFPNESGQPDVNVSIDPDTHNPMIELEEPEEEKANDGGPNEPPNNAPNDTPSGPTDSQETLYMNPVANQTPITSIPAIEGDYADKRKNMSVESMKEKIRCMRCAFENDITTREWKDLGKESLDDKGAKALEDLLVQYDYQVREYFNSIQNNKLRVGIIMPLAGFGLDSQFNAIQKISATPQSQGEDAQTESRRTRSTGTTAPVRSDRKDIMTGMASIRDPPLARRIKSGYGSRFQNQEEEVEVDASNVKGKIRLFEKEKGVVGLQFRESHRGIYPPMKTEIKKIRFH